MRQAITQLTPAPDVLLNDAVNIPDMPIVHQVPIIKGDSLSISIAAASIIAKVTRDRLMNEYDVTYPQYGFAKHKGYYTSEHIRSLQQYGPCQIHRRSFAPVMEAEEEFCAG
jgi:ribonuclease HII